MSFTVAKHKLINYTKVTLNKFYRLMSDCKRS